jgi:hypothetical protein
VNWPESIHEGLPPRDDEPAQLRSDIVDEIADHLACAMTHERRRTDDDTAARRNVLARFGNPAAIARRLWLDAMKENIMTQRIILVVVVVLTIAGITASFVAWRSMQEGREVNQALLAKLEAMSAPPPVISTPSSLSTLTVRLLGGSLEGEPIVGESIRLHGRPFPGVAGTSLSANTNEFGKVTFGPMNPGEYYFLLDAPFGFNRRFEIPLFGAQELQKDIVVPLESQLPGGEVDVSFKLLQLANVQADRVVFGLSYRPNPVLIGGEEWHQSNRYLVCVNDRGEVIPAKANFGTKRYPTDNTARTLDQFITKDSAHMYAGSYILNQVAIYYPVVSKQREAEVPDGIEKGSAFAYTRSPTKHFEVFWDKVGDSTEPLFEAKVGEANVWEIEIPEELVEQLREIIAEADEKAK